MYVDIGASLAGFQVSANALNRESGVIWGSHYDPASVLLQKAYLLIPQVRASAFFGSTKYVQENLPLTRKHSLPLVSKAYHGEVDAVNYKNRIFGLFEPLQATPRSGEKQLVHTSFTGEVRPASVGLYSTYDQEITLYGSIIKVPEEFTPLSVSGRLRRYITDTPGNPGYGVAPSSLYWSGVWGEFEALARQIPASSGDIPQSNILSLPQLEWSAWSAGSGSGLTAGGACSNYRFKRVGRNGYQINYVGYAVAATRILRYVRSLYLSVTSIKSYPTAFYRASGDWIDLQITAEYTDLVTLYKVDGNGKWSPVPGLSDYEVKTRIVKQSPTCSLVGRAFTDADLEVVKAKMVENLKFLSKTISPRAREYRRAAPFATNDAVVSFKSDSNFVEAILELPGITALITGGGNFEAVTRFLQDWLLGRGLEQHTARTILVGLADFLAGRVLLEAFAAKPTRMDHANLLDAERRLRWAASVLSSTPTARGRHRFQDKVGDQEQVFDIVVRSSFRVPPPRGEAVISMLQADNVGILPTPSRFWNAVFLSFLVDYVAKIGKRLEVIESYLFCLFLRVDTFVHTYKASAQVDEDWLPHKVHVLGGSIRAEMFVREVSTHVPDFARDGDLNLAPPRGPDGPVLLALVWALARSTVLRG